MLSNLNLNNNLSTSKLLSEQSCVKAINQAKLNPQLKKELNKFILRNVIKDCNKVSPHCLKAHMIKTAINLKFSENKITKLKKLFRARVGYNEYYLDAGKLKKI